MVRMMCGVKLRERKKSELMVQILELDVDVVKLVRRSRLRWYGHVLRGEGKSGIEMVLDFGGE